jgi:HK97 family phage major capsid protein
MTTEASTLGLLNEELEQVRRDREALRTKNPGSTMPEDARHEDEELVRRSSRIIAGIETEKQKLRDSSMAETARYMDDPSLQIRHPINADDESRRVMMKSGWDIRGGLVFRQTSRGEIAFCPEEVMFGPLPSDDPVAARHFRTMRAVFQPEYKTVWMKWLANRGSRDVLTGAELNALSEGVATEGGFTVPADVQAEILARRADASVFRSLATVRQTSRDRMQFPAVTPNASSGSIYSSGFVGGLVAERVTSTDQGPTFQQFEIGIKKFQAYTRLTNDLIADSGSDLLAFLATDGGRNLGLVEDNYFLNGIGTGLEPMGLLSAAAGVTATTSVEGTTTDEISSTSADAGSIPKIIAFAYTLPAQYAGNATWLMARITQGKIHALVDGENRPWWQPSAGSGGAPGAPATLLDAPVRVSPFVPVGGTNANKLLVFGDFSAYIIADRTALSVQVDTINGIPTDETDIYLRSRAGGGVWNTDAFRIAIV